MKLEALQRRWNAAGKGDPFWAVLSDPRKKGNRWQVEEFFRTGSDEIQSLIADVEALGLTMQRRRALDFGCGPGRLSQALASYFEQVDGVDISPSMIELAGQFNRYPQRCRFHVNASDDLALFPDRTFDFVYTSMTLQHLRPPITRRYLREFLRVLAPEGILVFQLPSRPQTPLGRMKAAIPPALVDAYRWLRYGNHPAVAMYGQQREAIIRWCESQGAQIIEIRESPADARWQSFRYAVRRAS